jgi:hypothetical protein
MAYKFKYTSSNLADKVVSYTDRVLSTIKYFRYSIDTNKLEVLYSTLNTPYPTLCGLPASSLSEGIECGDLDVRGRVDSRTYGLTVLPPSRIMFL